MLSTIALAAAVLGPTTLAPVGDADGINLSNICEATADIAFEASKLEILEDYYNGFAACLNITNPALQQVCIRTVRSEYAENKQLIQDVHALRLDICTLIGADAVDGYDPDLSPELFQDEQGEPHDIDNQYLPFLDGYEWVYEGETEDGFEVIVLTVTDDLREIAGVECRVVRDTVTLFERDEGDGGRKGEGLLVEDTFDYYAQDDDGNVWYFGELSFSYDDEGYIENIDGSWISGIDGAKAGIVMPATPVTDTTYRQEWWLGEAEDVATILNSDVDGIRAPYGPGSFDDCVQTADYVPLEPYVIEHKFYAPGIGFIREEKVVPDDGEVIALVEFNPGK